MKGDISKHITYNEATKSKTAKSHNINNEPDDISIENMKALAENIFEKVREHFNVPIYISSFYRSKELNIIINNGKDNHSQHCKGEAMDIDANFYNKITNEDIFNYIKDNLEFDQLINEFNFSWIHVSYKRNGNNRKQILST